jgi:hypothetical protein
MTRLFSRITGAALVVAAASVALTSGCADNDSSLFIVGVMVPEAPACTVTPDGNATILGAGVMDVAFTEEYFAWLLVGNQLAPRGEKDQLRTETARITLRGAEITILDEVGGPVAPAFTVPGTGFVTVDQSEEPGFGAFLATLVPQPIGNTLAEDVGPAGSFKRRKIVVNVRVFGDTLGGKDVESSELSFPIDICNGCTIIYHFDNVSGSACVAADTGDSTPLPCFSGQAPIDCTACATTAGNLCTNGP